MALNAIVEEIMKDEITATVYANDGSSQSGIGSYIVQSLKENGKQRGFPTFGIFIESRESLVELEAATRKILTAASFHRCSEKDIPNRIDFVTTDSTSHNLEVIERIREKLSWEHPRNTSLQYPSIDDASRKNQRAASGDTWFLEKKKKNG